MNYISTFAICILLILNLNLEHSEVEAYVTVSHNGTYGFLRVGDNSLILDLSFLNNLRVGLGSEVMKGPYGDILSYFLKLSDSKCGEMSLDTNRANYMKIIDSRYDFPYHLNHISDYLRANIVNCYTNNQEESAATSGSYTRDDLNIIRNTIDYNTGLMINGLVIEKLSMSLTDPNLRVQKGDSSVFYSKKSDVDRLDYKMDKASLDEVSSRKLFFDPFSPLQYALSLAMKIDKRIARIDKKRRFVRQLKFLKDDAETLARVGNTLNDQSGFIKELISLNEGTSDSRDTRLLNIQTTLLEGQMQDLESRKQYLESMKIMLMATMETNRLLNEISGKLDDITDILNEISGKITKIVTELKEVNNNLESIRKKLDNIDNSVKKIENKEKKNVTVEHNYTDSEVSKDRSENLMDLINEYIDDYSKLNCITRDEYLNLYSSNCLLLFFIYRTNGIFDNTWYYNFRYNNYKYHHDGEDTNFCLQHAGHSKKFTGEFISLSKLHSEDEMNRNESEMSDYMSTIQSLSELLLTNLDRNYDNKYLRKIYLLHSSFDYRSDEIEDYDTLFEYFKKDAYICKGEI